MTERSKSKGRRLNLCTSIDKSLFWHMLRLVAHFKERNKPFDGAAIAILDCTSCPTAESPPELEVHTSTTSGPG
jgi:hypothetical protein